MKAKLIALLAVFVLVVAACGGSDANPTTTTAAAPAATTTTAATPGTTQPPATTTTTEVDPMADWPDKVVFGFIPSERADKLSDSITPFMEYLSETLGIEVEGIVTADYNGLVVAMGTGGADFGAFGPLGYVQARQQYPSISAMAQSIRFGSDLYHGQWFTNDPSICESDPVIGGIENVNGVPTVKPATDVKALQVGWAYNDGVLGPETLEDGTAVEQGLVCTASLDNVKGKSIAFTSATSTSGAVYPQLQLLNLGIDIENDISYEYLGSHDSTVAAVYEGTFDIGLSYDDARRTLRKDKTDVGSKLIVFNITQDIPNDVVSANGNLPQSLIDEMYAAIQTYLGTDEGELVLDEIYGWTDIRPANEADFDVVREAIEKLGISQ
jgi:phosphonate transport system substrate-binding protein